MPKSVKVIFWSHFIVALSGHVLAPLMAIAALNQIFALNGGLLLSVLLLGLTFCAFVWGANHVADPNSYCWLTDLEKHYRKVNNVNDCTQEFLPRFYKKCRQILNGDFYSIPEQ